MDVRDLSLLISPIVAILVCLATIWFNSIHRRRHYAIEQEKLRLERQKIAMELSKAFLSGSKSFERRLDVYNSMMQSISSITTAFEKFEEIHAGERQPALLRERVLELLDRLVGQMRANQVLTTRAIHFLITQGYSKRVIEHLAGLERANVHAVSDDGLAEALRNTTARVRADGDKTKEELRSDLEGFVRGLAELGSTRSTPSRAETLRLDN